MALLHWRRGLDHVFRLVYRVVVLSLALLFLVLEVVEVAVELAARRIDVA